jgi:DNA-3-methyladenine glycosylase
MARGITDRFFERPALEVARGLVGCTLRHAPCAGRIVETEAYAGDPASHFVTRRPSAGALLGTTSGLTYVYTIYGMHLCLNVTADATGPGAVLLRALEPLEGLDVMRSRRGVEAVRDLCRGPGRLAQALGVTRAMSGRRFLDDFALERPARPVSVVTSPRIGISHATELPWRFVLEGSRFASGRVA